MLNPDAALDAEIARFAARGYRLTMRTESAAQLVKPKSFKRSEAALLIVVGLGAILLLGGPGLLLAAILLIGDLIWYAARRESSVLLTVEKDGHVTGHGALADVPPHLRR